MKHIISGAPIEFIPVERGDLNHIPVICRLLKLVISNRIFICKRRSPYIEIGESILRRISSSDIKDRQMCDLIDSIIAIILNNEIVSPYKVQLELMKCGFKVPHPVLIKVLRWLAKEGIIDDGFINSTGKEQ